MLIKLDPSALRQTKWHEYAIRFLLGGLITAATGLVAQRYGPVIAGLFLAFPAIFPAAVTLVERREREKKQRHGLRGDLRGRHAAALDSAGAAMGSVGLLAFAATVWCLAPRCGPAPALALATVAWITLSVSLWWLVQR